MARFRLVSEFQPRGDQPEAIESLANGILGGETHQVLLGVKMAIPSGLILNELITNCLKHAFPAGQVGEIHVSLHQEGDGQLVLRVADNGVGFPSDFDVLKTQSLGLRLVRLLTGQLSGQFEIRRTNPGTEAELSFSVKYPPRSG